MGFGGLTKMSSYINNLFGEIPEKNITFVIDTSGSMYDVLSFIKDHICEILIDRAYNRPGTTFNLIEFSSEITQWSDQMVECTPITVNAATRWLRGIESQTGSDMLHALEMAFDEPRCEAVYLLTDGMPDQEPGEIVHRVIKASHGRPVHCITVTDRSDELPLISRTFLEDLSLNTRGSFHIVEVSHLGNVKKVNELYNATYTPIEGTKTCSVEASLTHNPYLSSLSTIPSALSPHIPYYRYSPHSYLHTEVLKDAVERNPVASVVARGTRVLARRDDDGYYYIGHIAQDVNGSRSRFLIEFNRTRKGRDLRMQETALHDMIAVNDALRHSIVADDKVLAPWQQDGKRYGPGKVLRGIERRNTIGDPKDSDIVVTFWNGKTETIPRGVAVWIPNLLHDRIVVELQMPISARKSLIDSADSTELPSGYPSLPKHVDDVINSAPWDPLVSMRRHTFYHPWLHRGFYHLPTYPLLTPVPSLLKSWPEVILHRPDLLYGTWPWPFYPETVLPYRRRYPVTHPKLEGTEMNNKELDDLVDRQLEEHELLQTSRDWKEMTSSESDSDYETDTTDQAVARYPLVVDRGTNTKTSFLRRRGKSSERPEWKKYWPQTPQPRLHHQPEFQRRRPGMYSTWKDPDFGSYEGPINSRSMYQVVDGPGIKSDRARLMKHLKTPYVEKPEYQAYGPRLGSSDYPVQAYKDRMQDLKRRCSSVRAVTWADRENDVFMKARNAEDTKRQQALMRIGSDVEKQRQYENKLINTIEAKAKINQSFRNSFFQKELDNLNRQQSHADWLQARRNKFAKEHFEKVGERQRLEESRQVGREYRQARHHTDTVRKHHESEARRAVATFTTSYSSH
ncbi:unnamed protein product [Clavelina lepadiformis]|uniref:VWFA domain-containing protein n=1 Tax=Clavelina lepadiformis TaxID=159417 RepID=A0ABP0GQJ1_CLALP